MDLYRSHFINVRKEDEDKVTAILNRHDALGNLDDWTHCDVPIIDSNGERWTTFKIKPYIYEDFEAIVSEMKQAGIQIR